MNTPYFEHDTLLNYLDSYAARSRVEVLTKFRDIFVDLDVIIEDLEADKVIKENLYFDSVVYKVTSHGKRIVMKGGYSKYKISIETRQQIKEEKELLELRSLKQSVRKGSWEFWFMILGSIGGFISFIILVYQFVTGIKK